MKIYGMLCYTIYNCAAICGNFVLHMLFNTKFTAHPPLQPGGSTDTCKTRPSAFPASRFAPPAD